MTPYEEVVDAIIKKQALVLGRNIALARAARVSEIDMHTDGKVAIVSNDPLGVIEKLINQYQELLGPAAISFSKDAVTTIRKNYPDLSLPDSLT